MDRRAPAAGLGSFVSSAAVIAGCSLGSLRKYSAQAKSQTKLNMPRMTNEPRQDTNTSSPAIRGGVRAFPMRENEWVMPCAKPQRSTGVQLDIARVAVGNAAPAPNPNARRNANREANPPAIPVSTVETPTIAQHADSVNRAPSLSPIQPPMS